MSDIDPLDALREIARIERERTAVPADLRRQVFEAPGATPADPVSRPGRSRRRRRIGLVAGVAAASTVGVGVAVAAILSSQPTHHERGIACRAAPTLDSSVVGLEPAPDAIAACADLWRSGALPDIDSPRPPGQPVPSLVACIGPTGIIEVLPGPGSLCSELRLAPADSSLSADQQTRAAISQALIDAINDAPCASAQTVERHARDLLADQALEGWTVSIDPAWADTTCAKVAIDLDTKSVTVVGLPIPP